MPGGVYLAQTPERIASSVAAVTLREPYAHRVGLLIYNDSNANLYVKYGPTATSTDFTLLIGPGGLWSMPWPIYAGLVTGAWSAAQGGAQVTELR